MKAVKFILLALVVIFIAIQFVPDKMPDNKPVDERDIMYGTLVNENITSIIKTSCYDCHSNQTQFPWYAKMAPSSWLLADHINQGKSHMNFSEWEDYSKREKIGLLEDIKGEIESGEMPLKSYLLIHHDARLDSVEISAMVKWTEEATSKLLE
jgi:hypothetical protein